MNPHLPFALGAALLALPLSAQTSFVQLPSLSELTVADEVPVCARQVDLGYVMPGATVEAIVEYPEYVVLSHSEVRRLKALGMKPDSAVVPQVIVGKVNGRTVADVTFSPIVANGRRWRMLTSCKLSVTSSDSRLPKVMRTATQWMEKAAAAQRYATASVLAQGKWVKVSVPTEGVYQLTHAQLKRMGFNDPSRVKLYGYGGRPLPEAISFEGTDALIDDLNEVPLYRRASSVLFFAEGTVRRGSDGRHQQNPYASRSYYFLTEGDSPAEFPTIGTPDGQHTAISQATAMALVDNDAYCWYEGGRDFYEAEQNGGSKNYTLSLPGFDPSKGTGGKQSVNVAWDIANANSTSSSTVALADVDTGNTLSRGTVAKSADEGVSARGYRASFSTDVFSSDRVRLRVTSTDAAARLNYIRVNYPQQLSAANPLASFSPSAKGAVALTVADAKASTAVWQGVSGNAQAATLASSLDGGTLTAYAPDGTQRFVIVDTEADYASPEIVGEVPNQNLHAVAGVQYVVVTPPSGKLVAEAERLASFHASHDGLSTLVVRADAIYNEFSSGTPDATAIRRFLKMLNDRATNDSERPRYLVLFGDSYWDNRHVTAESRSYNADDFLPSYERSTYQESMNTGYAIGTLNSYVTDDYFGLLDDGEGASVTTDKLDVSIGRMPCHDAATAAVLVNRSIAYAENSAPGAWKNFTYYIADYGDNNLHMTDAESVMQTAGTVAGKNIVQRRLFIDSYSVVQTAKGNTYPAATERLKLMMQQGALVFNYSGHGSPDRLSHAFLIDKDDMTANVSTALPLWVFASCEICPYDQQVNDIARNLLYNERGGAVAVVCAARSVYSHNNRPLNKGVMKYLFSNDSDGQRYSFGDALRLTKVELLAGSSTSTIGTDRSENKLKFVLLGDPALRLAYAEDGVSVDSIDGKQMVGNDLHSLATGRVVTISGSVAPSGVADDTFNGTLSATLFAHPEQVICKGYSNTSADPYSFSDYTRTLYSGSVGVQNGRYNLRFVVPQGVEFSNDAALLSLYAVNKDGSKEYRTSERRICINSASAGETADTLGPKVYVYLDRPDFPDGGIVGKDATFYAAVSDSSSISVASGSLGHDIELEIDGNSSSIVRLNDYFSFDLGSYTSGLVTYPLTDLSEGSHTLRFRVWDAYDNSTTSVLRFTVREGGVGNFDVTATTFGSSGNTRFITSFIRQAEGDVDVETEVYNASGIRVWSSSTNVATGEFAAVDWPCCDYSGTRLAPGVYFYRSRVNGKETKAKKLVLTR